MSEARLQCTPIFNWNYSADNRFVINQGGTWSSKTYSILQALLLKLINGPGNEVCTVTADTFPALRLGAIRDFDSILAASGLASIIKAANFRYTFFNGSIIEFRAFTSDYDARNGKRQYLFINEANNVEHEIARQLIMRTSKQVYIDFNPSAEFWAHQNYSADERAIWFYSTYRENPFCPREIIDEIESYKHSAPELYRVFGLGKRGNFTGQVFGNVNWIS